MIKNLKILLIFLISFSYYQEAWSALAEFWIIENPSALSIYNNYQQRISDDDKSMLPAFSAWQIIEKNYILSDQFTNTIKTEYNHKTYFIQLSAEGEIVNGSLAGHIQKLRNASLQGDTVRIKISERLSLKSGDKQISLSEGMLIQRIFLYRNKTFARDIIGQNSGWIEGNGPANWDSYIPDNSNQILEKQIFSRIDQIFASYNEKLDKLFNYLNHFYNQSINSPQWNAERSPSYIRYTIVPGEYANQFSNSQSYLVQELNDMLYGSTYQLDATEGHIVISKTVK